jgi:hypothetical protein
VYNHLTLVATDLPHCMMFMTWRCVMRNKAEGRATISRQPDWDLRYSGWAAKFIAKNRWRCEAIYEFDDLMNDAYLIFRHIKASYPLVSEPSHIMALFKVAMINEFNDKAKYKQRKYTAEVSYEEIIIKTEDMNWKLLDTLGENNNEGLLRIILSELPPEVRMALEVFNDAEKLKLLQKEKKKSRLAILAGFKEKRESLNDALCKIIGLPKNTNLLGMLYSALTTE